jgi:alkane 1-monooxygenase
MRKLCYFAPMSPIVPNWLFAAAALTPAVMLGAGMVWGGLWAGAAFAVVSILPALLDRLPNPLGDSAEGAEFPANNVLLVALAVTHIILLPLLVWHITRDSTPHADKIWLTLSAAMWLGQIGNPAAHELIHRAPRALHALGTVMFAMILFGHHRSAHRLVHHVHVATPKDPNTARSGEGFYAFFLRAWAGSFARGLHAENDLRARKSGAGKSLRPHPYAVYAAISAVSLGLAYALGGWAGVGVWGLLALSAQGQILLSDYVQHYGLMRAQNPDGSYVPVSTRHSWNAGQWYSSAMMVNAPRHSDHHAHPSRPYMALRLPSPDQAPRLPWPLPLACTIALAPWIWRRKMRPFLKPWQAPAISSL